MPCAARKPNAPSTRRKPFKGWSAATAGYSSRIATKTDCRANWMSRRTARAMSRRGRRPAIARNRMTSVIQPTREPKSRWVEKSPAGTPKTPRPARKTCPTTPATKSQAAITTPRRAQRRIIARGRSRPIESGGAGDPMGSLHRAGTQGAGDSSRMVRSVLSRRHGSGVPNLAGTVNASGAVRLPPLAAHARLARPYDGLGPVGDLELAEDVRDMVAHGLRREHQALRDGQVVQATCDQLEDLPLALGELGEGLRGEARAGGGEEGHQPPCDRGPEDGLAAGHGADGSHDLGAVGALEQVPPRTGPQRREDRFVVLEHGPHEHGDVRAGGHDPACRLDAVEPGHPDVHEHHVRLERRRAGHGLVPGARLPADLQALDGAEQRAQAIAERDVIVGDEQPQRLGGGAHPGSASARGSQARTRGPPPPPPALSPAPPPSAARS